MQRLVIHNALKTLKLDILAKDVDTQTNVNILDTYVKVIYRTAIKAHRDDVIETLWASGLIYG